MNEEHLKKADPAAYQRWLKIEKQTQDYIKNKNASEGSVTVQRVTDPLVTVTIPVVVHVLFSKNEQNISDAQILSQIRALNRDFRRQNEDRFGSNKFWLGTVSSARHPYL